VRVYVQKGGTHVMVHISIHVKLPEGMPGRPRPEVPSPRDPTIEDS